MTIKEVKVINLFGRFSHQIKFNKGGISLIIGENGVGKTVCLTMIEALFNNNFYYYNDIDFSSMIVEFDDDIWTISKDIIKDKSSDREIPAIKIESINGECYREMMRSRRRIGARFKKIDDDMAIYLSILLVIIVVFLLIFGYKRKSDDEY